MKMMHKFLIFAMVMIILSMNSYSFRFSSRFNRQKINVRLDNQISEFPSKLLLGSPHRRPETNGSYISSKGVEVLYSVKGLTPIETSAEVNRLVSSLDDFKGVLLSSSYEVPGRYSRWTVGFIAPPLQIEGRGLHFNVTALNKRGELLIGVIHKHLTSQKDLFSIKDDSDGTTIISGSVIPSPNEYFDEENRSKQPSLFSLIRSIREVFEGSSAGQLGLYGSLGYDLTFQFEPIVPRKSRQDDQRDLVMYLPDQILVVDNQKSDAWIVTYDFSYEGKGSTAGIHREASAAIYSCSPEEVLVERRDALPGEYASAVRRAQEQFRVGNLFEVVLSQVFREKLSPTCPPSEVFRRLSKRNPSPYGFFLNLGREEYLVGASPEMFVRVEAADDHRLRIETCPISGTIARGGDALEDALQIQKLLGDKKEESELTMCTDVDRNDKSRVCVPGSVRVLGRRQIEMYSRLIHTVDHVEGILREGFDAIDAFLCHTWAVTVTGAPKVDTILYIYCIVLYIYCIVIDYIDYLCIVLYCILYRMV